MDLIPTDNDAAKKRNANTNRALKRKENKFRDIRVVCLNKGLDTWT